MDNPTPTNQSKPDWIDLNPDLLSLIAKKLPDIYSFIRFRTVCKKWRVVVSISDHPPLLPWLHTSSNSDLDGPTRRFYSFQHEKSHTVHIPQASNKHLVGPSRGFMLLHKRRGNTDFLPPSLLNPFTNVHIDLPFVEVDWYIKPIRLGPDPLRKNGEAALYMAHKIRVDPPPTNPLLYFAAIWRPDRNTWHKIQVPNVKTLEYCNGRLFTVGYGVHMTIVIDVETQAIVAEIPPPAQLTRIDYLVEAFGELLGVTELFDRYDRNSSVEDCRFDIYRLEEVKQGSWCWVKLSGIGNLMLFLHSDNGLAVRASEIEGAKGNCIYFLANVPGLNYVLARYDVAEGRAEAVPGPIDFPATWIVPALY